VFFLGRKLKGNGKMKVNINNKNYNVPELTFKHFTKMEEQGFSIVDAFQKKQMMLMAMGFTCAVTGLDRDEAEDLLEQHVLGGGDIRNIVNTFGKTINESDFFKKMLGLTEKQAEKAKQKETENQTEDAKSEKMEE